MTYSSFEIEYVDTNLLKKIIYDIFFEKTKEIIICRLLHFTTYLKDRQSNNVFFQATILPKNEQMNSFFCLTVL